LWKHEAHIYLPPQYESDGNIGIIGTACEFFQADSEREFIPETGRHTETEYAEGTALDLNMPIIIFAVPGEDFNGMHESDLMGYANQKLFETGDLTWNGYYPIIKAYLRAITLGHSIPEIGAERAVLFGCSKRGHSVCNAAGVDPERVAGIVAACYPGGNHLYQIAMKFAQFGPDLGGPLEDHSGPGYQPASVLLRAFNTPLGLRVLSAFDPYLWRDQIKACYLVAIGTNDEFYGLGSPNEMIQQFNGDKAFLAVDNLPHSWVSEKHLVAWRMWLLHTFYGRNIPVIKLEQERSDTSLQIRAGIESTTDIRNVRAYYAYNPLNDWRFAKWSSVKATQQGNVYSSELKLREKESLAFYVEVEDFDKGSRGLVSSLVSILPQES
jgi:PhoPQ-activated pathogenicity-related protein